MSVYYDLYETFDLARTGEEQPLHARVVPRGTITADEFVNLTSACQHVPHAQLVGSIEAITRELQDLLLEGYTVEVGELGHFSLSLEVHKQEKERKKFRSGSISMKAINLRINRRFKKEIAGKLELERIESPYRVKNPLVEDECLKRLLAFLEKQPCINRMDYSSLTGKIKRLAIEDLNIFIEKGILKKYGSGRSVVYMKV